MQNKSKFFSKNKLLLLAMVFVLIFSSFVTAQQSCGNGVVETGEVCDDGVNNGQQNMCNSQCTGLTTPVYSNGGNANCPGLFGGTVSNFVSGGYNNRQFELYMPPNPNNAPVLFAYHYLGGQATWVIGDLGLINLTTTDGFIIVSPHSTGNAQYEWFTGTDPNVVTNPDIELFDDVIACLHNQYNIDLDRIYATGHSAGAAWTSYLSMHRQNELAGVVTFSGGLQSPSQYVSPPSNVPTVLIWGGPTDTYYENGSTFAYNNGNPDTYSFHEASMDLSNRYQADSNFVIECQGNFGHNVPAVPLSYIQPFLNDHPKWVSPNPYNSGLPASMPSICQIPNPSFVCGNGILEAGEACELGDTQACTATGGYPGTQSCNSQCSAFNSCTSTQFCGDNVTNGNELCDDGVNNGQFGFCDSSCMGTVQNICGNNILETGEVCDGNSQACTTGSGYSGTQTCTSQCDAFNTCTSTESCGDGTVNGPEICDDGANNGQAGFCNVQCTAQTNALSQNLLVHWTFDPDTTDQTGNGFNGYATGSGVDCTVPGEGGNGCLVGNNGDFLHSGAFPYQASEPLGIAMAAWVNLDSNGYRDLVVTPEFFLTYTGSDINCALAGNNFYGWVSDPVTLQTNQWYHVACSYDPATSSLQIFRDGVLTASNFIGSFTQFTDTFSVVGLKCANIYWCPSNAGEPQVTYDDVRFYNRALDANDAGLLSAGSTPPVCGNGAVEFGETCDDGALNGQPNQCNSLCTGTTASICGNAVVEAGEVCDGSSQACLLGGYSGSQACNSQCTGYDVCTSTESCGDNIVNGPEVCDGNSQACTTGAGYSGTQACTAQCDAFNTCTSTEFCGDNVINGNELCDDGANNGQVGFCDSSCMATVQNVCGNNVVEGPEVCDGNTQACTTGSGYSGTQTCTAQCDAFNTCTSTESCGDGIVNGNEVCDSGANNGQPGFCNSVCTATTTPVCGNGVTESGETCDDGLFNGNPTLCNSFCSALTTASCGNGVVETGEVCDNGAFNGEPNLCNSVCTATTVSSCGNAVTEAGETCDDGSNNGLTGFCNLSCNGLTP